MELYAVRVPEEDGHPPTPPRRGPRRRVEPDHALQPLVGLLHVIDPETQVPEPYVGDPPRRPVGLHPLPEAHQLDLHAAEPHHSDPVLRPLKSLDVLEAEEPVESHGALQVLHYYEDVVEGDPGSHIYSRLVLSGSPTLKRLRLRKTFLTWLMRWTWD